MGASFSVEYDEQNKEIWDSPRSTPPRFRPWAKPSARDSLRLGRVEVWQNEVRYKLESLLKQPKSTSSFFTVHRFAIPAFNFG